MPGDEAMALVQAARPVPVIDTGIPEPQHLRQRRDTVLSTSDGREISADALAVNPSSPAYRSMIPNPPCARCGADHNPLGEAQNKYGHPYLHPDAVPPGTDLTVLDAHAVPIVAPVGPAPAASGTKRVSIIPARGEDSFIVAIEVAPDWDLEDSWRLTSDELLPMLPVLRILGVKIRDNTAGELKSLEMERNERAGQHAKDNVRASAPIGRGRQGLQGRDAGWPGESIEQGGSAQD